MSNNLVNAYWEANLPKNFVKPASNADTRQVTKFLTDKYVSKLYVDKFVKRCIAKAGGNASESDEEEAPAKKTKQAAALQGKVSKAPSRIGAAAAAV